MLLSSSGPVHFRFQCIPLRYPWDTLSFFCLPSIWTCFTSSSRPPSPLKLFPTAAAATSKWRLLRRLHGRLAQRVRQLQGLLPGWCNRMPCSRVQLQLGTCHSCAAQKKRSRNTETQKQGCDYLISYSDYAFCTGEILGSFGNFGWTVQCLI